MNSFFKTTLIFLIIFSSFVSVNAQSRQVIIGLDESGSMTRSWDELNYALQTIISLIDEKDELFIITGSASNVLNINAKNKINEVKAWYRRFPNGLNGESQVIRKASQLIQSNQSKESLLILIGDGAWAGTGSPCKDLSQAIKNHKKRSRVIFFKIGSPGDSSFETEIKGNPFPLEKIYTAYGDEVTLKQNLNNLANIIVEGKNGNVNPVFTGGSIKFTPVFPLKKVIVLMQNSSCSITNINSGFDLNGPIEISNVGVLGNLEANCYEVKAKGGSVINAGAEIILNCSSAFCCTSSNKNLKIIPIVALDLVNEVEGNFIESNKEKREFVLCDKETEITMNSYLVDKNGKKISLAGKKSLKIKASNGRKSYELTFSNTNATGVIPLVGNTTIVTVESSYDGYFQKKAEFTFIKKRCPLKLDIEVSGDFKDADETNKIYKLCPDVKEVDFVSSILDDAGILKSFTDFNSVDIFFKTNGKKTALNKKGNKVFGTLELEKEDTKVRLVLDVNGASVFESSTYTFKRIKCGPEKDKTILEIESSPVMEFVREGKCIDNVKIRKADGSVIDHRKYTFEITGVPFEFNVQIDSSQQELKICFEKKAYLCDCFIRYGDFGGFIIATPKDNNLIRVDKEWTFTLVKEGNFFTRCKTCLIIALILGFLCWYLYGIWTKPRFHASARFEVIEEDKTAIYAPPNKRPRKKLPTTFFNRYLIPYLPESKIVDGMQFKATRNKGTIYLVKESLNEKLSKNGEPTNPKAKKDLKVFRNNTLEFEKRHNITIIYTLKVK